MQVTLGPWDERGYSLGIPWVWSTRGGRRDCASRAEVIVLCRSGVEL